MIITYDFDGVIVDSCEAVFKFYDTICLQFNLPFIDRKDKKLVEKFLSATTIEAIDLLCPEKKLIKDIIKFIEKMDFSFLHKFIKLQPNIKETLSELQHEGHNISLFTNRGNSAMTLLKYFNISDYFNYIITSKDVTKPKPSGEGLIKIINYFKVKNSDCIYIGDTKYDYLASLQAKTHFIYYNLNPTENNIKSSKDEIARMNNHTEIFYYLAHLMNKYH